MAASAVRARYSAERTSTGGWLITIPGAPPSQNLVDREHYRARMERVGTITRELWALRMERRLEEPVFSRATLTLAVWFAARRRRDPLNYLGGAKQHVDALRLAGWLLDDDESHLRVGTEPHLGVDREFPRTEMRLECWDGTREWWNDGRG